MVSVNLFGCGDTYTKNAILHNCQWLLRIYKYSFSSLSPRYILTSFPIWFDQAYLFVESWFMNAWNDSFSIYPKEVVSPKVRSMANSSSLENSICVNVYVGNLICSMWFSISVH